MIFMVGLICFGIAAASGIYVDKQRFYRRNAAGIEEFDRYSGKVKARVTEGLTLAIGTISGLAAMICIAVGIYNW